MDLTITWKSEMNKMLVAFDRQVTQSLGIIRVAFQRNGLSLSPKFKQYFLKASNTRIEESYDQFELALMMEDQVNVWANINMPTSTNIRELTTRTVEVHTVNDPIPISRPIKIIDARSNANKTTIYPIIGKELTCNRSAIIEICDSDDEGQAAKRPIIARDDSSACIKVEDDIKAEQPEIDDGEPIVVVDVPDEVVPPNVGRPGVHGIENGITRDAIGSSKIMNKIPNVCSKKGSLPRFQAKKKRAGTNSIRPAQKSLNQKKERRVKCSHCDYTTYYIGNLEKHIRTHSGEKPFQCDRCNNCFRQRSTLKRHMKVHAKEFPFHCPNCYRGFYQEIDEDAHEKVCKTRRYECHICKKKSFLLKCNLQYHIHQHTDKRYFRCEICMKFFTQKGSLKRHLDSKHSKRKA
ncbi:zinc finger protein 358-like [Contarinia nasturtii]|uniref:zinc finger protein 358-like n=1 Tax=Contarinia nasturtii TaxID=265458 RepID=UPI0012D47D52|nr:zinc finger protein 358-like [Contarinia nasturtii]